MAGTGTAIDAIIGRENAFYAAQTGSDLKALDELMSDDMTTFAHSTGVVDTKATYLAGVRDGRYVHGPITRLSGRVRIFGDVAVSTSVIDLTTKRAGAPPRTFRFQQLMVWKQEAGAWRLFLRQATTLPL
jgi:ketosteroid isomerase-like protein